MKNDRIWALSLIVAGVSALILVGSGLARIMLPDWLMRTLGMTELIAGAVLIFTSVRKLLRK